MFPNLVLLILEFFPARIGMLPNELDSNVIQLLANLLTKAFVFYYFDGQVVSECYQIITHIFKTGQLNENWHWDFS